MDLATALPFAARHAGAAWPEATAVLVSGSVARGTATPTSDLDVVVLLPSGGGAFVVTQDWDGTATEVFAYDPEGLDRWLARDAGRRRPTLSRLLLGGVLAAGDEALVAAAQERARAVEAAGPRPYDDAELVRQRLVATDLLLDLESHRDVGELVAMAATLWPVLADLALVGAGHWSGTGKWQVRMLREHDADLAERLVAATVAAVGGDPRPLVAAGDAVLAPYGGRFFVGRDQRG